MRISDWSSDVCSSDLAIEAGVQRPPGARAVGCDNIADFGHAQFAGRDKVLLARGRPGLASGTDRRRCNRLRIAGQQRRMGDAPGMHELHEYPAAAVMHRSEEHTSELQSLMRISYAVFCLNKKKKNYRK